MNVDIIRQNQSQRHNNPQSAAFKALHMKKKVKVDFSKYSKEDFLSCPEIAKAANKFEVVVKKYKMQQFVNGMQNSFIALSLASLPFVSAPINFFIAAVSVTMIMFKLATKTIVGDFIALEVGEEAKKNIFGKTCLKGIKVASTSNNNLSVLHENYYDTIVNKIIENAPSSRIKDYILNGKIELNDKTKQCLSKLEPEDLQAVREFYAKQQLTQDEFGNLPLHVVAYSDLNDIYFYLKDDPKTLIQANLTRNNAGNIPVHLRSSSAMLIKALKNHPKELTQILTTKNPTNNRCVLDDIEISDSLLKIIGHEDAYLEWKKTEYDRFLDKNYKFFDGKKIFEVLTYLLNNIQPEAKNVLLSKIKCNKSIMDFNKKDRNGITPVEMILYSEDMELLELLKGQNLNYYPELDYVYNGLKNEAFKQKVKKLQFRFKDIEEAIRLNSKEAIDKIEPQFKSPLFNVDASDTISTLASRIRERSLREYFFSKYLKYLQH